MKGLDHALKIIAVICVALLVAEGAAAALPSMSVEEGWEAHGEDLEAAVARFEADPGEESAGELRQAMDSLPPALRSSPALRELREAVEVLEDPVVMRTLLPLLRMQDSGLMDDPDRLMGRLETMMDELELLQAELGLDGALLEGEYQALEGTLQGLDLTDPEATAAQISSWSDEEIKTLQEQMVGFSTAWDSTSDSPMASSLHGLVEELADRPPTAFREDVAEDDALLELFQETASVFLDSFDMEGLAEAMGVDLHGDLDEDDQKRLKEFRKEVIADVERYIATQGLDQDAFAGNPQSEAYPYASGAGPVTIDGQDVQDGGSTLSGSTISSPRYSTTTSSPVGTMNQQALDDFSLLCDPSVDVEEVGSCSAHSGRDEAGNEREIVSVAWTLEDVDGVPLGFQDREEDGVFTIFFEAPEEMDRGPLFVEAAARDEDDNLVQHQTLIELEWNYEKDGPEDKTRRANRMESPGTPGSFPTEDWVDARPLPETPPAQVREEDGVEVVTGVEEGQPEYKSPTEYPGLEVFEYDWTDDLSHEEPLKVYHIHVPRDHYVRLFLEYPDPDHPDFYDTASRHWRADPWHNIDLNVQYCKDGPSEPCRPDPWGVWSSRSDDTSITPFIDTTTFVHDPPCFDRRANFVNTACHGAPEQGSSREFDSFLLWVREGSRHVSSEWSTPYLLRGDLVPYDKAPDECLRVKETDNGTFRQRHCGPQSVDLNWVGWGNGCREGDRPQDVKCRENLQQHPPASFWHDRGPAFDPPVVFLHGIDSDSTVWTAPEANSWYESTCVECTKTVRYFMEAMISQYHYLMMMAAMVSNFIMTSAKIAAMGATSGLVGVMAGIAIGAMSLAASILGVMMNTFSSLKFIENWREGSDDVKGHFWAARDLGRDPYWVEYNRNDTRAESGEQLEAAAWQLKMALNGIKQDHYDRYSGQVGYPYASPNDVQVDLVTHDVGGLIGRIYTTNLSLAQEGTYASPMYGTDVNKLIMLHPPNRGATAMVVAPTAGDQLIASQSLSLITGLLQTAIGGGPILGHLIEKLMDWAFDSVIEKIIPEIRLAPQGYEALVPDPDLWGKRSWDRELPASDVDHGIMYGTAFNGFPGVTHGVGDEPGDKLHDMMLTQNDALKDDRLTSVSTVISVPEDHRSTLHADTTQEILDVWLTNPTITAFTPFPETETEPAGLAGGPEPLQTAPRTLFHDKGQMLTTGASMPGTVYDPPGGATAGQLPQHRSDLVGDPTNRLDRLTATKGLDDEGSLRNVTKSIRNTAAAPEAERENLVDEFGSTLATARQDPGSFERATRDAADIGVLHSGHHDDTVTLLNQMGEPFESVDVGAPYSELAKRDILVVPTGGLFGLVDHASLQHHLERFLDDGGSLFVLAQANGRDLDIIPGGIEGFGFKEEASAFRDGVVFGSFAPALAGFEDPQQDVHVDGSFTSVPDNTTVLLQHARNARPVAVSYPAGEGNIVAGQLVLDWATKEDRATAGDRQFVRDAISWLRFPDAVDRGAAGAELTLDVDVGPINSTVAEVHLVLVDAGAKDVLGETFPPNREVEWTLGGNWTRAGFHEVDAVLLAEDGRELERRYGLDAFYTSHFAASPGGFRPSVSQVLLDVTGPDRVEEGQTIQFSVTVTNNGNESQDLHAGWWWPEHAAATGDPAYGAGPDRDGAPPAWEANFRLPRNMTLAPAEAEAFTITVPHGEALRSDSLAIRVTDEDGTTLSQAQSHFRVYTPDALLNVTTTKEQYVAGETVKMELKARDRSAQEDAPRYRADFTFTLRGPDGVAVDEADGFLLLDGSDHSLERSFSLPSDAPPGVYRLSTEAYRDGQRIGGASTHFTIPELQVAVQTRLPDAFTTGQQSPVTLSLSNPGLEPVMNAFLTLRLVDPDGVTQWDEERIVSVSPGDEIDETFQVTPTSTDLGRYSLQHQVELPEVSFEGGIPAHSGFSGSLRFDEATYRAGEPVSGELRIVNTGMFSLPIDALVDGGDLFGVSQDSAMVPPGGSFERPISGILPGDMDPGDQFTSARVTVGDSTRELVRGFNVPPARIAVEVQAPDAPVDSGTSLAASLHNSGGAAAAVPWTARLINGNEHVVARSTGETVVGVDAAASLSLQVPDQAATGKYRFQLDAGQPTGGAVQDQTTVRIRGVAGQVALDAPSQVDVDEDVPLTLSAQDLGDTSLENAVYRLHAARAEPLPAWDRLSELRGANAAVEHDGAFYLAQQEGLLQVTEDGQQSFGVQDGLPAMPVMSLASAGDRLWVGTAGGLAWLAPDGSWGNLTQFADLPTRAVRALAAGEEGTVYAATDSGVFAFDGSTVEVLDLPAMTAFDLAHAEGGLWASLANVDPGFPGTQTEPVEVERSSPGPLVGAGPQGTHLVYLDPAEFGRTAIKHVLLDDSGEPLGEPFNVTTDSGAFTKPTMAVDSRGHVHIVWDKTPDFGWGEEQIRYRQLDASGEPVTDEVSVSSAAGALEPDIALDSQDNVAIVWSQGPPPRDPWFAKRDRDGGQLVSPRGLAATEEYAWPQVEVDNSDNIHVLWNGWKEYCPTEDPEDCYQGNEINHGSWTPTGSPRIDIRPVSELNGWNSGVPAITVGPDDQVHLFYREYRQDERDLRWMSFEAGSGATTVSATPVVFQGPLPSGLQVLGRETGEIDFAWMDARSGRVEGYHNVFDPGDQAFAFFNDTRINALPENDTEGRPVSALAIGRGPSGLLYAAWENKEEDATRLKLAVSEGHGLQAVGAARLDVADGSVDRYNEQGGTLPSNAVASVAAKDALVAFSTPGKVTLMDPDSGARRTLDTPAGTAKGPLEFHNGHVYLGGPSPALFDTAVDDVEPLPAGGPGNPQALASTGRGLLAVSATGGGILRDDREDRFWEDTVPVQAGTPVAANFSASSQPGRIIVHAGLENELGQRLAHTSQNVFVHEGDLALAVAPAGQQSPGEPINVLVTVGNRAPEELKDVHLRLDKAGNRVLDERLSLATGEARTFTASVDARGGATLEAVASASFVNVAGAAHPIEQVVVDHVRDVPVGLTARILAPDVSGPEPFQVDALLMNSGPHKARVELAVAGHGDSVPVEVPPGESVLESGLAWVTMVENTTLTLRVTGDTMFTVHKDVVAGERVLLTNATGLTGPPGERVVTLGWRNAGPLDARFELEPELEGDPLENLTVALAPGGRLQRDLVLDLEEGLHELTLQTPWEDHVLRLAAGHDAFAVLEPPRIDVLDGEARIHTHVDNAGPGPLEGLLLVGTGFARHETPVRLSEGEVLKTTVPFDLEGVNPGPILADVVFERHGHPIAEESAWFEVPGPVLRFIETPSGGTIAAGDPISLDYIVENVGEAVGPAKVRLAVDGEDAVTKLLHLAPGERGNVSLDTRIAPDVPEGTLSVVASAPGDEHVVNWIVAGPRIQVDATAGEDAYPKNGTGEVILEVLNEGALALELVAIAHSDRSEEREGFTLEPGGSEQVTLPLRLGERTENVPWRVTLGSGRSLEEGRVPLEVDLYDEQQIRVTADRHRYTAGDLVEVKVETGVEGRVDLLGPGFQDAFVLNGTTTRSYQIPFVVPTGHHSLLWNFDATEADGDLSMPVDGLEGESRGLQVTDEDGKVVREAEPGDVLNVSWDVHVNAGLDAVVMTWFEDAAGVLSPARAETVQLKSGGTALRFDREVPSVEPGSVRFGADLILRDAGREFPLAGESMSFDLRGLSLLDAYIEHTEGNAFDLRLELASGAREKASVKVDLGGDPAYDNVTHIDGFHELSIPLEAPEPGVWPVDLVVGHGEGRLERSLTARVPGIGTPPETSLRIEGANVTREDGQLVLGGGNRLHFNAHDPGGSGVAQIQARSGQGFLFPEQGPARLEAGWHNLSYFSVDRGGNEETEHRRLLLVDATPPQLDVSRPIAGSVHVAGALTADPVERPGASVVDPAQAPELDGALLDKDHDGFPDVLEVLLGSVPDDDTSTPAWLAPPMPDEDPVVVVDAMHVVAAAQDRASGVAGMEVYVSGERLFTTTEDWIDEVVSLSHLPAGDHVLEIFANDHLGNTETFTTRLLLLPAGPEGLLATDPFNLRYSPWQYAVAAWLQGLPHDVSKWLIDESARLESESEEQWEQLPPAVRDLPEHLERQVGHVEDAVRECCLPEEGPVSDVDPEETVEDRMEEADEVVGEAEGLVP